MNYKNTHIRALATLLAFASVIIAPASASAQNTTSQQPAAAGSSASSDKTNQAIEQSDAQSTMTLDQKRAQGNVWYDYYMLQDKKLYTYIMSCKKWANVFDTVATPAIKKHGTAQEKETAAAAWKDILKIIKGIDASWGKIGKALDIEVQTATKSRSRPSEQRFADWKKTLDDLAGVFNAESENVFKGAQTVGQYYQTTSEVLDRIINELKKNPKTEAAAETLASDWSRGKPAFIKTTAPITVKPLILDPNNKIDMKTVTAQEQAMKPAAQKAGKQKQRQ